VPKFTSTATPDSSRGAVRMPRAPRVSGHAGIDLRTLRRAADPGLAAAVEDVLADPDGLEAVWYSDGGDATGGGIPKRP
jgi:hypothetical protein